MVKVTRTVNIDLDVWEKAKLKTDSISSTLNTLLRKWVETVEDKETLKQSEKLKSDLSIKEIELAKLRAEIDKYKKENERKRIIQEFRVRS